MFEALLAATATTGLLALARQGRQETFLVDPRLVVDLSADGRDLPCPWCNGATSETDDRCPTCGRKFG